MTDQSNKVAMTPHELEMAAVLQGCLADALRSGAFNVQAAMHGDMGLVIEVAWWPDPDRTSAVFMRAPLKALCREYARAEAEGEPWGFAGYDAVSDAAFSVADKAWEAAYSRGLVTCAERPADEDGHFDSEQD